MIIMPKSTPTTVAEKVFYTVREMRVIGVNPPEHLSGWTKQKREGRFYVRARWRKGSHWGTGGEREYHIGDVRELLKLHAAADHRFTDEPFTDKNGVTWIPRPLLMRKTESGGRGMKKGKLKYWTNEACEPLGRGKRLASKELLATYRPPPESGKHAKPHDYRWTVYHREDELDQIVESTTVPEKLAEFGVAEAMRNFRLTQHTIEDAIRDGRLDVLNRRVPTRTRAGSITVVDRPTFTKAALEAVEQKPRGDVAVPDDVVWSSGQKATEKLGLDSESMLFRWSDPPKHPTAVGNERKKKLTVRVKGKRMETGMRGYVTVDGARIVIRTAWFEIIRVAGKRKIRVWSLFYRNDDLDRVAADRQLRKAEPYVDGEGVWYRLVPLAASEGVTLKTIYERLKAKKPAGRDWRKKPVPGATRPAVAIHVDELRLLGIAVATPVNGNGQLASGDGQRPAGSSQDAKTAEHAMLLGLVLRGDSQYPLIDGKPSPRKLTLAEYEAIAFCAGQHAQGIERLRNDDLADLDYPSRRIMLFNLAKDPVFGRFIDSPQGRKGRGFALVSVSVLV
jgi:hypothetical protein